MIAVRPEGRQRQSGALGRRAFFAVFSFNFGLFFPGIVFGGQTGLLDFGAQFRAACIFPMLYIVLAPRITRPYQGDDGQKRQNVANKKRHG